MSDQLFGEFPATTHDEWVTAARASLPGVPLASLSKTSYEGIEIDPLISADDSSPLAHLNSLPGQAPFLRGTTAAGYRAQPWLIAQDIDLADPGEFNAALTDALANGQTAITLSHSLQLSDAADLRRALADIDLRRFPLFIRRPSDASAVYAWLADWLDKAELSRLRGCAGCDPMSELARAGHLPAPAFDQLAAHVKRVEATSPLLGSIAIGGAVYHDAGANATQELALTLATGVAYLRQLRDRQLRVGLSADKMQVSLSIGENFFVEVAKFRAIKLLWAQMLRAFGLGDSECRLRLYAEGGRRNKTRRDPHVNLLRATTEALAAAIGGVDGMTIAPFDEARGPSAGFSRRLSRNLQLILQEELQLTQLIDPAGGAWHVEKLTDQLARAAWALFQAIEAQGGLPEALASGWLQAEIENVAALRRRDLTNGEAVLVGSSRFINPDAPLPEAPRPPQSRSHAAPATDGIRARPLPPLRLEESLAESTNQRGESA